MYRLQVYLIQNTHSRYDPRLNKYLSVILLETNDLIKSYLTKAVHVLKNIDADQLAKKRLH